MRKGPSAHGARASEQAVVPGGPLRVRVTTSVSSEPGSGLDQIVEAARRRIETGGATLDGIELVPASGGPGVGGRSAAGRPPAHRLEIWGRDVHDLRLELSLTIRRPDGGRVWGYTMDVPAADPEVEETASRLAAAALDGVEQLLADKAPGS
jgi:hypothetical protein